VQRRVQGPSNRLARGTPRSPRCPSRRTGTDRDGHR